MTIESQTRVAGPFAGTGIQTDFPFTFKVFQESDVYVVVAEPGVGQTTLLLSSAYSVILNANQDVQAGGIVRLVTPLQVGSTLVLTSNVAMLQRLQLTNQGGFYPSVINGAMDRLTILVQQLARDLGLTIRLPMTSVGDPVELPTAADRAGRLLAFDEAGRPIVTVPDSESAIGVSVALAIFQAALQAAGGTAKVGFRQFGGDAAQLTAQMKLYQMPVSPLDYHGVGNGTFDDSDSWDEAAGVCREFGRPFDGRSKDWKLTRKIDMSFIPTVLLDKPILDARGPGTSPTEYLLTFGDPSVDGFTARTDRMSLIGELNLVCLDGRATPRRGVYIKGAHLNLGHILASNYNGTGIHIDTMWDTTICRLVTELCGNVTSAAMLVDSYGDTSNCMKILSIQCELSVDKGMYFNMIRSEIGNIHAEKLYVTTTNDGTAALQNGSTYVNHQFILGNCKIGQAFIDALPAATPVPGGGTTPTSRLNIVFNASDATVESWQCPNTDIFVTGGGGLTLSTFNVNSAYQQAPANNTTFNDMAAFDRIVVGEFATVNSARADRIDMANDARNVNFFGGHARIVEFTQNIKGNINFYGMQIEALGHTKAAAVLYAQPTFADATIVTYYGGFDARAVFRGGLIGTVTMASQTIAEFRGVEIGTFDYAANPCFLTDGACKAYSVTKWSKPTNFAWPRGTTTVRLGYQATTPKELENRDGALDWGTLTTSP